MKRSQTGPGIEKRELLLLSGVALGFISWTLPWFAYDSGATRSMYQYPILGSSYLLILVCLLVATLIRRLTASFFLAVFAFVWPAGVLLAFTVNPSRLCMELGCPSRILAGAYLGLGGGLLTLAGGWLTLPALIQAGKV